MPFDNVEEDKDKNLFFRVRPDLTKYSENIPPAVYQIHTAFPSGEMWLSPCEIKTEGLVKMEDRASKDVLRFIEKFFKKSTEKRYKDYGVLYRGGVLMHGAPGVGKTYTMHRVKEAAVKAGYIILVDAHPNLIEKFIRSIRDVTKRPEHPILVIWDEFEHWIENGYEKQLLELLDGVNTLEHVLYLGMTNYINKIPERIRQRPSRFNLVLEIQPPTEEMRRAYFEAKLRKEDREEWLEKLTEATDGFVLDFCKELLVAVLIYGRPLENEVNRLKRMAGRSVSAEDEEKETPEIEEEDDQSSDDCEECQCPECKKAREEESLPSPVSVLS